MSKTIMVLPGLVRARGRSRQNDLYRMWSLVYSVGTNRYVYYANGGMRMVPFGKVNCPVDSEYTNRTGDYSDVQDKLRSSGLLEDVP